MDDCAGDTVTLRLGLRHRQRRTRRITARAGPKQVRFSAISIDNCLRHRHTFDSQRRSSNGYVYGDSTEIQGQNKARNNKGFTVSRRGLATRTWRFERGDSVMVPGLGPHRATSATRHTISISLFSVYLVLFIAIILAIVRYQHLLPSPYPLPDKRVRQH